MALIACPECSNMVSDRADACPHCGCPSRYFTTSTIDISVGDSYVIGSFDGDPIEWLVLDVRDDRALLISKKVLDSRKFNEEFTYVTWEHSDLRAWMNDVFLSEAFTPKERDRVIKVTNPLEDNDRYNVPGGAETQDSVFCLSIKEAKRYFASDVARVGKPTKSAVMHGAWTNEDNGACYWWLRTPGGCQRRAAIVFSRGAVYEEGRAVHCENGGVRPALWLKLSV